MSSSANLLAPDQLKELVNSGLWRNSPALWNRIALRSMDLGLRQNELGDDFWMFNHGSEGAQFQLFHDLFDESNGSETSKSFLLCT